MDILSWIEALQGSKWLYSDEQQSDGFQFFDLWIIELSASLYGYELAQTDQEIPSESVTVTIQMRNR